MAIAQEKEKMNKSHQHDMMEQQIDHEARAMVYADKMSTRLGLNIEQKEKVQQAEMKRLEDEQDLMAEMMHETGSKMKEQHKKVEQNFREDMKEILTDAQYAKWKPMYEREMKMHNRTAYKKGSKK
ncbi:hypothetical protein GCM10023164_00100 [Christiangramia aestuarii]